MGMALRCFVSRQRRDRILSEILKIKDGYEMAKPTDRSFYSPNAATGLLTERSEDSNTQVAINKVCLCVSLSVWLRTELRKNAWTEVNENLENRLP